MNRGDIDKKLELYEQGMTSIEEEKDLVNRLGESITKADIWFNYIKQHKKIAPQNLESDIWASIQKIESRKRRLLIRVGSVAASIVLALSVFFTIETWPQEEMSYQEKEAALKEAMALLSKHEQPVEEILYEDEILIIYTK